MMPNFEWKSSQQEFNMSVDFSFDFIYFFCLSCSIRQASNENHYFAVTWHLIHVLHCNVPFFLEVNFESILNFIVSVPHFIVWLGLI